MLEHEGEKGGDWRVVLTSQNSRWLQVKLDRSVGRSVGLQEVGVVAPLAPLPCSYSLSQGGGATATPLTTGRSQEENQGELGASDSPPLKATDWLLM